MFLFCFLFTRWTHQHSSKHWFKKLNTSLKNFQKQEIQTLLWQYRFEKYSLNLIWNIMSSKTHTMLTWRNCSSFQEKTTWKEFARESRTSSTDSFRQNYLSWRKEKSMKNFGVRWCVNNAKECKSMQNVLQFKITLL